MDNAEQLKELKQLCILTFIEIRHLKKVLVSHGVIPQDDIYGQDDISDYTNSLADFIKELEVKNTLLVKSLSHM